jgi:DNA helicase-2/ATP-dependent DNA helicase PcrA
MSPASAYNVGSAYLAAAEELRPNPGQWTVYESEGNCVVLAGPGSGKTKTVTIKMARMLAEDVRPPRGIACITYSTECARELQRRLDRLGVKPSRNIFIGTIHSFCLKNIVLPYGKLAGLDLPEPLTVANSTDQARLFEKVVLQVAPYERPSRLRTSAELYRRTYLDREAPEWQNENQELAQLVEAYENELRSAGLIDFDDMVLWGLRLIEKHKWVRKILNARFPIFVIDEYQDLGLPLHRIVLSLCFKASIRLLAVGDPDQSIYGFTGAKPELLRDLADMEGIEPVSLQLNYRCGKTIVRASEVTLGEVRGYDTPEGAHVGTIDFYECQNGLEEQAERICYEIIPAALDRDKKRSLGDIAVLYLDRYDGDVIAEKVDQANMPFIRIDGNAAYRRTPLTRWLEDCAAWCSDGWKQGQPPLSDLIRTWELFNRTASSDEMLMSIRRQCVRFLWSHRTPDDSLRKWLSDFNSACLDPMLKRETELNDEKEALDQLLDACAPGRVIAKFTVAAFAGQRGALDHLNLITLHSAKGREFDVVIMMGMDQGRIPWINAGPGQRREQRRLFYVGLTRARHEVHMTYSGWFSRFGRAEQAGPSEFLVEVRDRLQEQVDW